MPPGCPTTTITILHASEPVAPASQQYALQEGLVKAALSRPLTAALHGVYRASMETPASLLETLRSRLREVQTKLVEINALRREEENLSALIRHYESLESGPEGLPDAIPSNSAGDSASFSLPRRMAVTVKKLLSTDFGPSAMVPDIFAALPKSLRGQFKGPNQRSNVETLRTQILTWQAEAGLLYDAGKVSFDPNAVPALFQPDELVLRTGNYRCTLHPAILKDFKQDKQFEPCPLGSSCSWQFVRATSGEVNR